MPHSCHTSFFNSGGKRGWIYEWIKASDSVQPGFFLRAEYPDMTVFILYVET